MDIQKILRQRNIKRFTLNAVASVIIALNAEVANATFSCPSIIGTSLAGVCDFDPSTGSSVTVENGGSVSGISMVAYAPTSSQIVINAGGMVGNTTGTGILISASSLTNGILNNGTINSTTGVGISISNSSTISGGLSNNGLISSGNVGIDVIHSIIDDGILNRGTISGLAGVGVMISSSSTISGGLSNNGMIYGNNVAVDIEHSILNDGIYNRGTISSNAGTGIKVNSSVINGGITNSGTIQSGGFDVGIAMINSTLHDGITNTGLIEAVGSGDGILMYNSTLDGGISNTGTIQSIDHNGITVLNVSHVQGDITNSGTIEGQIGLTIHNGSTLSGNIFNSGTISGNSGITIYSSATVSGGISNSGNISGVNTGIAITSLSAVSGGISNSGVIQGGTFAINIDPTSNVSKIDIVGQSARIIGAVEAVNTNINITSGSTFTSEGAFNIKNFDIASNATFNMANTISAQDAVTNAGILSVGNTSQAINSTNGYIQSTGGIFQIGITNATTYGQLVVDNAVDLSQSGNINVQVAQNSIIHTGDIFTNVMSGGSLISPTDGFDISDNSFIWQFTANANNTGVDLTAAINPAAYNACQGDYCENAANVIIGQVAAGNSLFSPYASLSTDSAFQTAASQATPELTNENVQMVQLVTRFVTDIVPMWSALHGKSAGDAMLYQPGKVWAKPYGGTMTQNESDTVDGFNATAYGLVIGNDIQFTEDRLFGGAVAIGEDSIDGKSTLNGQSIDTNTFQGMLYGARRFSHDIYVAGQGLIGYGDNDTSRSIPLYASTADGRYNSWFTNMRTQLGWNYAMNPSLILTPALDASYLYVYQGSYQESGSPMDLSVESSNNFSLVLGAYGNGAYRFGTLGNQQDLTITAYAGVARDVLNSQPQTTATFVAGGPSFSTFGVQLNEVVFRGGIGLSFANPIKPFRMNINYDLQTGNNAYSGVGSVTLAYVI